MEFIAFSNSFRSGILSYPPVITSHFIWEEIRVFYNRIKGMNEGLSLQDFAPLDHAEREK